MKRYSVYKINFQSRGAMLSGVFMGTALFALAVEYFFLGKLEGAGFLRQIFCLWLPIAACLGWILLGRVLQWNSPGGLSLLGAAMCLLLAVGCFFDGGFFRILLGLAAYVLCGGLLLLTAGGFLPGRYIAAVTVCAVMLARLILFHDGRLLPQVADEAVLAGFLAFLASLERVSKRPART